VWGLSFVLTDGWLHRSQSMEPAVRKISFDVSSEAHSMAIPDAKRL
jgi:hypothetical protein